MSKLLFILAFTADIIFLTVSSTETSDKCHQKCGANEIFVQCPDAVCRPKTCSEVGYPVPCVDLGPDGECPSEPGCICKEGYVKNCFGICVPMKRCRSCGGDRNARSGCGGNCGKHCSEYFGRPRPCTKICRVNGCDCKQGYYYDDKKKKCVSPRNCTPQCRLNERYETCPRETCTPQSCSQLGYPMNCSATTEDSPCPKKPACICNDGYVKNDKGLCIPMKQCPSCGGDKNAESGCGFECGKHCMDLYNDEPRICPLICRLNGCQCKQGKYYDEVTKKCVDPSKCTKVCRENEVLSECVNGGCGRRNCSQLDEPELCIDPITCKKGCVCRDGYLRHPNGTCVPINKCPCKENEVMSDCVQGGCQAKTCSDLDRDIPCVKIDPKYCKKGCLCKEGYLRDDDGTCVPMSSCTLSCTRPNELFVRCPPICPPQTCESINQKYSCPAILVPTNTTNCRPACRCKKGYFKNKIGDCISKENCLKCTGPNEYYSCGGACDNVCDTLSEQNQTNCPIINIVCNKMCYCDEGYARDKNNICIPIDECKAAVCGANEVRNECLENVCKATSCQQLGYPFACAAVVPSTCTEGCLCKDGYLRADNGTCIPAKCCPSCGGDTNAQAGCGVYCNRRCSNIGNEPELCEEICNDNTCDCKDGLYLDDNTGKCVSPKNCTPTCGEEEVYSDCIQGQCGPKKCCDLGKSLPCPRIDPRYCIKGCLCKEGYLRDEDGTCIPKKQCSSTATTEIWD